MDAIYYVILLYFPRFGQQIIVQFTWITRGFYILMTSEHGFGERCKLLSELLRSVCET